MREPEVVQLSEDEDKQIRFGVFCDGCGLSWRAQEVVDKKKTALQRLSAMPRNMMKKGLHPLRHSKSWSNMSASSPGFEKALVVPVSGSTFNLRQLSSEMEKGHGKQADVTSVKFTGIQCTCGLVTDATSLCFQIVDAPVIAEVKEGGDPQTEPEVVLEQRKAPKFTTTPQDLARGHGTPMLTMKGGVRHPNPLRSAPVTSADFE
ncbi:hypothetical protein ACN47E_004995 [Coniothyrium glycines]